LLVKLNLELDSSPAWSFSWIPPQFTLVESIAARRESSTASPLADKPDPTGVPTCFSCESYVVPEKFECIGCIWILAYKTFSLESV